ncbi:MAG TPA: ABC transporter permease, partial [Thermoanaerobaculia bacterium]
MKNDIAYAVRSLAKAKGFAAVAILTLAIALGANTAIFSVVSAILLQPLPVAQPEELVSVTGQTPRWETGPFSWPNYSDLKAQSKTLESVAGHSGASSFLYSDGAEPERLRGSLVTHTLWPLLGVKPVLGRWFTAKEDTFGQPQIVMISYELWQRRFGGDPRIIGRQIRLGAQPKIVTGVMPRGFKFPFNSV